MENEELRRELLGLAQEHLFNAHFICLALKYYGPEDQLLLDLYAAQDDVHRKLRRALLQLPGLKSHQLEDFDQIVHECQLYLLLGTQGIRPPNG